MVQSLAVSNTEEEEMLVEHYMNIYQEKSRCLDGGVSGEGGLSAADYVQ